MSTVIPVIPRAFVWRRLHSLTGLWLVIFLIEHLLTNSQAALWIGENGQGFVRMVNWLHNLPYLQVVEVVLLGVPFLIHMYWGVCYLFTSKANASKGDGSTPSLPEYGRNRAYSWQRITSWILLFIIIFHVIKFRFVQYPVSVHDGLSSHYFVKIDSDPGVYSVAKRLGVTLITPDELKKKLETLSEKDLVAEEKALLKGLVKYKLSQGQLLATTDNFGLVTLMSVRNTFKKPYYIALYTIFVLAACYHGFNGFWTFLLTWGAVLNVRSQRSMLRISIALIFLIAFLGLASVWGTYWVNLKS
jgi:succinate dehydrogenase cytochrome b subunit